MHRRLLFENTTIRPVVMIGGRHLSNRSYLRWKLKAICGECLIDEVLYNRWLLGFKSKPPSGGRTSIEGSASLRDIRLMAHKIDVQLPVQFEDFYVLSFGEINASPLYYGTNYIWPIGYKSCWHEKFTGSLFICEVSNNIQGEPLFTITRTSCSKSPIPCGQTILCQADLDDYKLPEIDPDNDNEAVYEDVIGDLFFHGSSPSSTWKILLEKIADVHEEVVIKNGCLQCYCRHATHFNFLSSVYPLPHVSIDIENFLSSQRCVKSPAIIRGDKETREFSKLLLKLLKGYGLGLDIQFVQEFIEQLHGVDACSGYILCKDRVLDSSLTILNKKIKVKSVEPFPLGSLISSKLSSDVVGNLLQVHEFICRFQKVLGVEDYLSYEDLENELLFPCAYGFDERAFLETVETNFVKYKVDKLSTVHMALLPRLVAKLLRKIAKAFNITGDVEDTKKNKNEVKLVKLETFPINPLTWPEVARRYILACLLMGGKINSLDTAVGNNTKLIRCLQGDDGIFSGSPAGVAGADVDAQLLGRAIERVFGKLERERSILPTGTKLDNSDKYGLNMDFSIPEWAKVLDPVRKLPTNVGSRIRHCVRESLTKNPPEWAKKLLEASISKEVYKGNASGPTKRAVIDILKRVSEVPQTPLPPGIEKEEVKSSKILSDAVMKKCRVILRQVAAHDSKRVFCDLVGRNFNCDDNEINIVFGNVSRRPLDLRTIDLRLEHGAYGGSHEAFLEDVREVWINLRKAYMSRPSVIKLVDEMSNEFNLQYEKEVLSVFKRFYEQIANKKPVEEIEKELEKELLNSSEIPKVPWETGICKVCGLNRDDTNVLLCDTEGCNAEYHTYCLNPPLNGIPEGDWFCPKCVPRQQEYELEGLENVFQFLDKNCEESVKFLEIVSVLEKKEYWELDADKKTFLLKFLCDELLKTGLIRTNLREPQIKVSLRKELLGSDSNNRFYWGFPNTSTHHGIVVHDTGIGITDSDSGAWRVFQTDEQIKDLVNYLKRTDPNRKDLRSSILKWKKSMRGQKKPEVEGKTVFSHDALATKASEFLEAKYNTETDSKLRRKNMAKWHRCECMEPVLPCRYHCIKCHETFFTNVEFEQHKNFDCSLKYEPIVGPGLDGLRQLKINLFDMEAALPDEAKKGSKASSEWRSEWCAFIKSANTIYEMVEATIVLESMIKVEYIKNTWWWYWSSMAAATKTSTISALSLRIYTLDAAIDYQKTTAAATTSSGPKKSKRRKHAVVKVKGKKKETEG